VWSQWGNAPIRVSCAFRWSLQRNAPTVPVATLASSSFPLFVRAERPFMATHGAEPHQIHELTLDGLPEPDVLRLTTGATPRDSESKALRRHKPVDSKL
jgi:hypothetical protein